MSNPSPSPPNLDPPFRGYIETTFDALLVFEAARRGMIPRVTRRLIERERGMVQSGAVFVFDEHESGIKRWTDGLVWSPSRILGNFLVYRETDKRANPPPTPMSTGAASSSPNRTSPSGTPTMPSGRYDTNLMMGTPPNYAAGETLPPLGQGALQRNRSGSDAGSMTRHRERQLVGSLTNSYKFKDGGLVKKTMSVTVNGFAQHMISYYSLEDVMAGKLRCPSTIPELSSLEISPEYLHKQNFRFPPLIEVGPDGIPRYRGEPEEPTSPQSPVSNLSMHSFPPGDLYDPYGTSSQMRVESPRARSVTVPMPIPMISPGSGPQHQYASSAGSNYFDQSMLPPNARPDSSSSIQSGASTSTGAIRPQSSSRRYEAYGPPPSSSPRTSSSHLQDPHRRASQGAGQQQMYYNQGYDVKPAIGGGYHYQPPPTAPGAFADFYAQSAAGPPGHMSTYQPPGYGWQSQPPPPTTSSGQSQSGGARLLSSSAGQNGPSGDYANAPPPTSSAPGASPGPGGGWQSNGHASGGWVQHGQPPSSAGQGYVGQVGEDWRSSQGQSLAS